MGRWRTAWLVALCFGICYLWWLANSLVWSDWFLAVPFFAAELYFFAFFFFSGLPLFFAMKQKQRMQKKEQRCYTDASPCIAAVIPVCGEPPEVVRPTIQSALCLAARHESVRIFVSDDKQDAAIRQLAEEFGVTYYTHPPHQEAKAGNLNRALKKIRTAFPAQWLLVIDAGDIIHQSFLATACSHMENERIAFIQVYRRFHPSRFSSFLDDGPYFYGVIMPRRNTISAAFACGSGVLWRICALDTIDGFSSWNIVEDLATSYMLQRNGWQGVYINTPLLVGSGSPDLQAFVRQRFFWAVDGLRILFWQNPVQEKRLPWQIRFAYAEIGFAYLLAIPILCVRFVPIIALWGAFPILRDAAGWGYYWIYFLPYFFARGVSEWTLFHIYRVPFAYWRSCFNLWEGLAFTHCAALWHAIRLGPNKKVPYSVTPKVIRQKFFFSAIRLQSVLLLFAFSAIGHGFLSYSAGAWLVANTAWIVFGLWILLPFLVSAAATSSSRLYRAWRIFLFTILTFGVSVLLLELVQFGFLP